MQSRDSAAGASACAVRWPAASCWLHHGCSGHRTARERTRNRVRDTDLMGWGERSRAGAVRMGLGGAVAGVAGRTHRREAAFGRCARLFEPGRRLELGRTQE